jgi:hypothetical protein
MADETGAALAALARDVRALKDRNEISELPRLYSRGIDTFNLDLVLSLFAKDTFIEGSRSSGPYEPYYRKLTANIAFYKRLMHYMMNQIVRVDGDTGHVETYAIALHWLPDSHAAAAPPDLALGVIYADDCTRIDGKWLITHRKATQYWRQGDYHPQWDYS